MPAAIKELLAEILICFGHSHVPHCKMYGDDRRRQPGYSYGLLSIESDFGSMVYF